MKNSKRILAFVCAFVLLFGTMTAFQQQSYAEAIEEYEAERSVPSSNGPYSDLERSSYTGIALNRSTPEEKGIKSEYIIDLLDYIEKKNLEVHAMMMGVGEDVIYEAYYEPYGSGDTYQMNSMSKLITNTAIGIAVDQGLMSLEDSVTDVLAKYVTVENENLKKQQLKHLVTMTGGRVSPVDGYNDAPSWAEYILAQDVPNVPGTNFLYDSSLTNLSSTMLLEETGKNTDDFLAANDFFTNLGFGEYFMGLTPDGANSGAGSFKLNIEDLLKVGMVYLHGGIYNGTRILSEDWVNKSLGYDLVVTGHEQEQLGYKFHWYNKGQGFMYALGANGQTLLICPELDLTIATVGRISAIVQDVLVKTIVNPALKDEDHIYDGSSYGTLMDRTQKLTLLSEQKNTSSDLEEVINGKVFTAEDNAEGLMSFQLDFTNGNANLTITDNTGTYLIDNGMNSYIKGTTDYTLHSNRNPGDPLVSVARWIDDTTLELRWFHPNSMYIDVITFQFSADGASAKIIRSGNEDYTGSNYPVINFTLAA